MYIEPLRRTSSMLPYHSEPISSLNIANSKIINRQFVFTDLSNNEAFYTPDLLRFTAIQSSLPDNDDEITFSPILNSNRDSRFFPISSNPYNVYSNGMSNQVSYHLHDGRLTRTS